MSRINTARVFQDEIAVAIQEACGLTFEQASSYAEPVVRYLQQQYGGDELYIPQPYTIYEREDILAERNKGTPIKVICERYAISRRTYFRILGQGS